jgi:hypothetical protein
MAPNFRRANTLIVGCGRKTMRFRRPKRTWPWCCRPGISQTKAIAEEGFIYGLPLVMNYG